MEFKAYAEAVKHPSGNVIGEELFQSGIIPSDTDFRIFRDFGHIPGFVYKSLLKFILWLQINFKITSFFFVGCFRA